MKLVIVESPFAGDIEGNLAYARAALRDCLSRGEAPIASHLLYTQPGVLEDGVPEQRELGIAAGLAWRWAVDYQIFYTDRGWSRGMIAALQQTLREPRQFKLRSLEGVISLPPMSALDIVDKRLLDAMKE